MKDAVFAFVVLLPFLFFVVWWWGWAVGYGEAKLEDRKDRSKGGAGKVVENVFVASRYAPQFQTDLFGGM